MRNVRPLFIALPALLVLLALLPVGPMGGTAHAAPTYPTIDTVAIDLDPTGNTGSAINGHAAGAVVAGDIQNCITVAPGAVFNINVVLDGLPPTPTVADRLAGFNFDITYPTAAPAVGAPPNLVAPGLVLGNDDDGDGLYDEDTQTEALDQDGNNGDGEEGPWGPNVNATIGHDVSGNNTTDFPGHTTADVILPGSTTDISVANGLVTSGPGAWATWRTVAFKTGQFTAGPKAGVMDWIQVTAGLTPGAYPLTLSNVGAGSSMNGDYTITNVKSAFVFVGSPPPTPDPSCDDDADGVPNAGDNCISVPNPTQADFDGDGVGDACDPDIDGDGVANASDQCASTPLSERPVDSAGCSQSQVDADMDGVCDPGKTSTLCAGSDTCPGTPLAERPVDSNGCSQQQLDADMDGVCDPLKTSTLCTGSDTCPGTPLAERPVDANGCSQQQLDGDMDGVCDPGKSSPLLCMGSDTCPGTPLAQRPVDSVGCSQQQVDADMDGVCNPGKTSTLCAGSDNCPTVANAAQTNTDVTVNPPGDALGDACDPDDDDDGASDLAELATNPPGNAVGSDPLNPGSRPEACDGIDNDGNEGNNEGFPNTDGDSLADCVDPDDDNDLWPDVVDNCDTVVNITQADIDADGVGDACDDFDGDGVVDATDNCLMAPNPSQANADGDALGDTCDPDDDNDTVIDIFDNCRTVPNPGQADFDADGAGDACDDYDGDGVVDATDNCILVQNPGQDAHDSDGRGDACDPDDDGDGIFDGIDGTWDGSSFTGQSIAFSDYFTDQHLGGLSYGHIVSRGTITVQVSDLPDPDGFLAWGIGSGSPGSIELCLETKVVIGQAAVVGGCTASTVLKVLTGVVSTQSGSLQASLPAGAQVVIEATGNGFSIENSSTSTAGITVNGAVLQPGTLDDDKDSDGFLTSMETFIGTNANVACGGNAWPPDIDGNNQAGLQDILRYIPVFGSMEGDGVYNPRYDMNADHKVGLQDILRFIPVFGLTCTP